MTYAALFLAALPSLATALTMEELVAVLDEDQVQRIEDIDADFYPRMLATFVPVLELSDQTNKDRAIRRIFNFYESPEQEAAEQLLSRFERYGVETSQVEINKLLDFAVTQEIEFERQILATAASIEQIDVETARMRAENVVRHRRLKAINERLAESREQLAVLLLERERLLRLIASTDEVISDLEALR